MKRFISTLTVVALLICPLITLCGCNQPTLPTYEKQSFVLAGFWEPYELNEQTLALYKQSGLNTLALVNHNIRPRSSDTQSYLGSNRTLTALQLCKQLDLKVMLHYGDWVASACDQPYGNAPFSQNDLYGEYADQIIAMHIADEPNLDTLAQYGNDRLIDDYKSVYSVPYLVNLFPNYVDKITLHARSYEEYLDGFEQEILSKFENNNPIVSVDFYPFRSTGFENNWLRCYEQIATLSTKYHAITHCYIQSAQKTEFADELGEKEIRLQVNVALCFGAKWLSYYCYANPMTCNIVNGNYVFSNPMYEKCMLDENNQPTNLYDYVRNVNGEIQSIADAYLNFDYVDTVGITSKRNGQYNLAILKMFNHSKDGKASVDETCTVQTDGDIIVGKFAKQQQNAYMLVNFGEPSVTNSTDVWLDFDGVRYVAVYRANTPPTIMRVSSMRKLQLTLDVGESAFVVAL